MYYSRHLVIFAVVIAACVAKDTLYEKTLHEGEVGVPRKIHAFTLKNGQCHGVLTSNLYAKCKHGTKVSALLVHITDHVKYPEIVFHDELNKVVLSRKKPCHGPAKVHTEAGCSPI